MRKTIRVCLILLVSACLGFAGVGAAAATEDPLALQTTAPYAVIMDYNTGTLMFSKAGDQEMAPASMAKLMTAAVIFQRLKRGELKLDDTFTVSERAWRLSVAGKTASSKMFVSIGSQIRVEDLLRGIIIQSGNDACTVVAEHFSGSEEAFAELMNAEARRIGLKNSVFRNASGLPHPEMKVTAHDLAILAAYLIREYPEYYRLYSEREFTWNRIRQANRNPLLGSYPGADGLKTGHTSASGYGLVGSAVRDGRRLIMVINGLPSEAARAMEAKRLMDIGFREFKPYSLFAAGAVVDKAPVWGGGEASVPLVAASPLTVLMRRDQRESMRAVLTYDAPLSAPVRKGQVVGQVRVSIKGLPDQQVPVAVGADVPEGSLISRAALGLKGIFSEPAKPESINRQVEPSVQDLP
jgi:D-alanyl-D-alanine carboxypeptidase (penicillin-binding protein 5/6)